MGWGRGEGRRGEDCGLDKQLLGVNEEAGLQD